jgi:hypothetical protein
MKKTLTTLLLTASTVAVALAQTQITIGNSTTQGTQNLGALNSLLVQASQLLGNLVPVAVTLAVLAFFWYLIVFIWKGKEDGAQRKAGLDGMMYSILALFVMVAIWGIVGLLANLFGVNVGGAVPIPVVPVIKQN